MILNAYRYLLAAALLTTCIACVKSAPNPVSGLPTPVVPQGFGINIHFTDPGVAEIRHFGEAGFGIARMDFCPEDIETSPGVYDFQEYDELTDLLESAHCRPLYILANRWNSPTAPHDEASRADFAKFAGAAAAHFKGRGIIWELWNEPDGNYWHPSPDIDDYSLYALATARAIRQADPDACIVAPGAASINLEWIKDMLTRGLLPLIDGASVHPYRGSNPETVVADYLPLRKLIAACTPPGRPQIPIVCSEWGYSTSPIWQLKSQAVQPITEQVQGNYLLRMWLCNLTAGVNLTDYYDWRDRWEGSLSPESHMGAVHQNGRPKLAYAMAKQLIHDLYGYRYIHRLTSTDINQWNLLFRKGNDLAIVTWTTDAKALASAQTPAVHTASTSEPGYDNLLRASSIEYSDAPVVATATDAATLSVKIVNSEATSATVSVAVGDDNRTTDVAPGHEETLTFAEKCDVNKTVSKAVNVTWNGAAVSGLPPVTLATVAQVEMSVQPSPGGRVIHVDTLGAPFKGQVEIDGNRVSVTLDAFSSYSITQAIDASKEARLAAIDDQGRTVSRMDPVSVVALKSYPVTPADAAPFRIIAQTGNQAKVTSDAQVVPTPANSPALAAIAVPAAAADTQLDVRSTAKALVIPDGARELDVWVNGDNSNRPIWSVIMDSGNQGFQYGLGALNWKGWKLLQIPLSEVPSVHWGGADDGIRHPPLHWGAILTFGSRKNTRAGDQVLVAAPYYVMP